MSGKITVDPAELKKKLRILKEAAAQERANKAEEKKEQKRIRERHRYYAKKQSLLKANEAREIRKSTKTSLISSCEAESHNDQRSPQLPSIQSPEEQAIQFPEEQLIQSPEEQPIQSSEEQPRQSPEEQLIRSSEQQPIQSPAEQPIQSPEEQPRQSPEQQLIQSPEQQPIRSPEEQPRQSPEEQPRHHQTRAQSKRKTNDPPPPPVQPLTEQSEGPNSQPIIQVCVGSPAPGKKKNRKCLSTEEKREYEKEKKRRQRKKIYADEALHEKHKAKLLEYKETAKRNGTIKVIADMDSQEKDKVRKQWRKRQETHRNLLRKREAGEKFVRANTPPLSPSPDFIEDDPPAQQLFVNAQSVERNKKSLLTRRRKKEALRSKLKRQCKETKKYQRLYEKTKKKLLRSSKKDKNQQTLEQQLEPPSQSSFNKNQQTAGQQLKTASQGSFNENQQTPQLEPPSQGSFNKNQQTAGQQFKTASQGSFNENQQTPQLEPPSQGSFNENQQNPEQQLEPPSQSSFNENQETPEQQLEPPSQSSFNENQETPAHQPSESPSPRKKVENTLLKGSKEVRKKLLFAECLIKDIKSNVKNSPPGKKAQFTKFLTGPNLKKYRVLKQVERIVSLTTYKRAQKLKDLPLKKRTRLFQKLESVREVVKSFYCDAENTTLAPGKKDCITRKKVKRQKRYLNDTLKNLHGKFIKRHLKIGFSTFAKLKPFFVVQYRLKDRDTCACIRHVNFKLKLQKAKLLGYIASASTNDLIKNMTCSGIRNKKCMMNECEKCKDKLLILRDNDKTEKTFYHKWIKAIDERVNKQGKIVKYQVLVKKQIEVTVERLITAINNEIPEFFLHAFVIYNQYEYSKKLKMTLNVNEAILNVDFSENYSCKYQQEVQSFHFGASRRQITLHTGVMYSFEPQSSGEKVHSSLDIKIGSSCLSFCTISDDPRHTAPAIWGHLRPVLEYLSSAGIIHVYIFSDGPSGQYKNKYNFFFLQHFAKFYGFHSMTWNFWASGHGKGPSDGVGAVCKRRADDVMCRKEAEITNAKTFVNAIKGVNVIRMEVMSDKINEYSELIPENLERATATKKIHQIFWSKSMPENTLKFRDLSCTHTEKSTSTCEECPFNELSFAKSSMSNACEETVSDEEEEEAIFDSPCSNNVDFDHQGITLEDWVAVSYTEDWHVGIVTEVHKINEDKNQLTIKFMKKSILKQGITFSWPAHSDIQNIFSDELLCKLDAAPQPTGRSARTYVLKDSEKIQTLFENETE